MEDQLLKQILEMQIERSQGKQKLNAECALIALDTIILNDTVFLKLSECDFNNISECQINMIKDGFSSIKAEYTKIFNIVGGTTNDLKNSRRI